MSGYLAYVSNCGHSLTLVQQKPHFKKELCRDFKASILSEPFPHPGESVDSRHLFLPGGVFYRRKQTTEPMHEKVSCIRVLSAVTLAAILTDFERLPVVLMINKERW